MVYSLRQPGQLGSQIKSLCEKIHPTYQNFYTGNNPAAGTMSIGLPADAQAAKVFAALTRTATNHTGWPL
jgi:hypothetical protein